jgi:hypothetical protein
MTTTPERDADGIPIFGAGGDHTGTVPFNIEIHDRVKNSTWAERFEAHADLGAASFLAFTRAAGQGEQGMIVGALQLLNSITTDGDGLPSTYEDDWKRDRDRALGEHLDDGGRESDFAEPVHDPRLDDVDSWSSRRRFMHYVSSTGYHVAFSAIVELAQWLVRELVSLHPTQARTTPTGGGSSKASSRGSTRKRSGSAASRSRTAST